jgi:hypothetical protein
VVTIVEALISPKFELHAIREGINMLRKAFCKHRILLIITLLIVTKVIAFIYLFNLEFKEPYGRLDLHEWWLIFHRWASAFYDRIAAYGYENLDLAHWAFLPGFPFVIKIVYSIIGHSGMATALAGLIFGILWVPIYYKVALMYGG